MLEAFEGLESPGLGTHCTENEERSLYSCIVLPCGPKEGVGGMDQDWSQVDLQ